MNSLTWILGAPDPEMEAIEALLIECNQKVAYAMVDGKRVEPPTAYTGDVSCQLGNYVTVECRIPPRSLDRYADCKAHIDHHVPGDVGYGRPPTDFLAASSIGQVISELARSKTLPRAWNESLEGWPGEGCGAISGSLQFCGGAYVATLGLAASGIWYGQRIPGRLVLIAAADHCLGAAYKGECPGVDPIALGVFRAEERARFSGRPSIEVLADIEATTEAMESAPAICIPTPEGGRAFLADMRRGTPWPELPEAATRAGLSYVAGPLVCPDGRRKFTVSGTPSVVRAWLDTWSLENGIVDTYGDPARGFAGGYAK